MSNILVLDKRGNYTGIFSNDVPNGCPFYEDEHRETLQSSLGTFECKVPANNEMAQQAEVEGYLVFKDLDGISRIYTIKEITDSHSDGAYRHIYCEDTAVGELVTTVVRTQTFTSSIPSVIMEILLADSDWSVGQVEFNTSMTYEIQEPMTSLECLHDVAEYFGGELEYSVKLTGTLEVEKLVHLRQRRGSYTGKIFEYGKDVESVEKKEDSSNLVTALVATGADGLTFADVYPPTSAPYYKIGDYVYNEEAFQRFSKNGKHLFGVYKDASTNGIELFNNAKAKLEELSRPFLTYECSVISLERITGLEHEAVRIGDSVIVKDMEYNPPIVVEARVVEIVRSMSNPMNDRVVLGDYRAVNLTGKVEKELSYNRDLFEDFNTRIKVSESEIIQLENAIILKVDTDEFDALGNRVSATESSISVLDDEILLKVSTDTFNILEGRVDTAESSISLLADEIALKVSTATFNVLAGRMDTAESNIIQNANQIALKVSTTTFNALENRVDVAESEITQNADNILLKVSKNEVISSINLSPESIKLTASKIDLNGITRVNKLLSLGSDTEYGTLEFMKESSIVKAGILAEPNGSFETALVLKSDAVRYRPVYASTSIYFEGANGAFINGNVHFNGTVTGVTASFG